MTLKFFIGILAPRAAISAIQSALQVQASQRYGYDKRVTHGNSDPHVTIVSPFEASDEGAVLDALDQAGRKNESISIELSGFGKFDDHTIYAVCTKGYEPLRSLRSELMMSLNPVHDHRPHTFHASIARKFEPQACASLWAAAQDLERKREDLWPVTFRGEQLTLFRQAQENGLWQIRTSVPFTSVARAA